MCSERRRVQGEMAVFVDLYEWRGSYTLQGFRPLLFPLLSYARATKLRTSSTVVHSSRHIAKSSSASASIRQAEGSKP